jgi:hypothetical protein
MVIGRLHQPKPGDAARRVIIARADERSADLRPTVEALQASDVTSLRGIAAALKCPYPARKEAVESNPGATTVGADVRVAIDTLLEQADSIRCAVVRNDLRDDKIMLSECEHEPR